MGKPIQYVQRWTSSTEFVEWQTVLSLEEEETKREDWLVARLCWEIRRASGEQNLPLVKSLLMEFTHQHEPHIPAPQQGGGDPTEAEKKAIITNSKLAFGVLFGSQKAKLKRKQGRGKRGRERTSSTAGQFGW